MLGNVKLSSPQVLKYVYMTRVRVLIYDVS